MIYLPCTSRKKPIGKVHVPILHCLHFHKFVFQVLQLMPQVICSPCNTYMKHFAVFVSIDFTAGQPLFQDLTP
ncbi:MAG: hypothetical protein ACYCYO_07160 [Bacilli bacterium]